MESITAKIDARIEELVKLKNEAHVKGRVHTYDQMWARVEELRDLKKRFVDRDGKWLI